jgi:hypothetical protein
MLTYSFFLSNRILNKKRDYSCTRRFKSSPSSDSSDSLSALPPLPTAGFRGADCACGASSNFDRREKLSRFLAVHRDHVPEWADLTPDSLNWRTSSNRVRSADPRALGGSPAQQTVEQSPGGDPQRSPEGSPVGYPQQSPGGSPKQSPQRSPAGPLCQVTQPPPAQMLTGPDALPEGVGFSSLEHREGLASESLGSRPREDQDVVADGCSLFGTHGGILAVEGPKTHHAPLALGEEGLEEVLSFMCTADVAAA